MNTLCGKKVLQGKDADDATNAHLEEPVKIEPVTVGMCDTILDLEWSVD
jgi:cell division control protein 11